MRTLALSCQCDLGDLGEDIAVEFLVHFFPGIPESGRAGRPEDYDAGQPDEVDLVSAMARVNGCVIDLTPILRWHGLPDALRDTLIDLCAETSADDGLIDERDDEPIERMVA